MKSDDITKLGLLVAEMKGDNTEYDKVVLTKHYQTFVYTKGNYHRSIDFSKQALEYLAEQNEEAKHLIVK